MSDVNISVLVVHGVGRQKQDYAVPLIKGIKKYFKEEIGNISQLKFEAVHWSPTLEKIQNRIFKVSKESTVRQKYDLLRELFIYYAGDAIIYQKMGNQNDYYSDIHRDVAIALTKLAQKSKKNSILVMLGHSLGSVISSNFLWDALHNPELIISDKTIQPHMTPKTWNLLDNTAGLFTFGSPLLLWANRYKEPRPVKIPSIKLKGNHPKVKGKWFNVVDPYDVLAYPLQPLNEDYKKAVKDIELDVGGILSGCTPASHVSYWEDEYFQRYIAKFLAKISKSIN